MSNLMVLCSTNDIAPFLSLRSLSRCVFAHSVQCYRTMIAKRKVKELKIKREKLKIELSIKQEMWAATTFQQVSE